MAAGDKHALTVFISRYPQESGWNCINSDNDKKLILTLLDDLGFDESGIICLEDEQAVCANILNAFERLLNEVDKGDEVYIHFSCHGQQITDLDKDESIVNPKDRYDEALVPYDAYISYDWNGYKGENHLSDDMLHDYLSGIAVKVGRSGCVVFVADACHSGDVQRDRVMNLYEGFRGTFDRFELPLRKVNRAEKKKDADWISLSACKDFQTNYEFEYDGVRHGRLSFAVSRCLKPGITVEEFVNALQTQYADMPLPKGKAQTLDADYPKSRAHRILFP